MHSGSERTERGRIGGGIWGSLIAAGAAMLVAHPAPGAEPHSTSTLASTPLWNGARDDSELATTTRSGADLARTNTQPDVTLGRTSASLKQVARRVLGNQYPCAAVGLMLFEPPSTHKPHWELTLAGLPTPTTAALIADDSPWAMVEQSMNVAPSGLYVLGEGLFVTIRITTETLGRETAGSTLVCTAANSNGAPVSHQPVEPPVRVVWNTSDRNLLALYETAPDIGLSGTTPAATH